MKAIPHLTLNTGHTRMSPRSEVSDHIIPALASFTTSCAAVPIPRMGGVSADVSRHQDRAVLTVKIAGKPVLIAFVAWAADAAESTWAELVETARAAGLIAPVLRRPDTVPWLAAMLTPAAAGLDKDVLMMLGDLERCWAWAVLESR